MKSIFKVLRLCISLSILIYLLTTTDFENITLRLRSFDLTYFLMSMILGMSFNFILAYRWKILLPVNKIDIAFPTLVRLYFVGSFFNLFLPTSFGGDVARGYGLLVSSGKKMEAVLSVLMERLLGFSSLVIIVMIALEFNDMFKSDPVIATCILLSCIAYLFLIGLLFNERVMVRILRVFSGIQFFNLGHRIPKLLNLLRRFKQNKKVLFKSIMISIGCQILSVLSIYLLALSIHLHLSIAHFYIIIPIIWAVTMIPVSINGLGVREGAFVFFFTRLGVQDATALLLSLLGLTVKIAIGLIGGLIYIFWQFRDIRKKEPGNPLA